MKNETKLRPVRALLLWALAAGTFAAGAAAPQPAAAPVATPQPVPPGVGLKFWQDNESNGRYVLQVIEGTAPKAGKRIIGIVTTDTDRDPEAQGVSHCHNVVKMADGTQMTVIDSHNMHRFRCLGAGDQMTFTSAGKGWVVGTLLAK